MSESSHCNEQNVLKQDHLTTNNGCKVICENEHLQFIALAQVLLITPALKHCADNLCHGVEALF